VLLDRTVTINVTMELAGQAESVVIHIEPPPIDRTTSSTGQTIDTRAIESMPLNGRNYLDLILLTPGVAVNDNARSDLTNRDTHGSIFGERAGNTAFLIDGVENNDDFRGGVFESYAQDAIPGVRGHRRWLQSRVRARFWWRSQCHHEERDQQAGRIRIFVRPQ